MSDKIPVTKASSNIFADLDIAEPEEALAKSELAAQIAEVITKRKLTQAQAAALLGVDQPKVSALLRGRLTGFSTDRLIRFLTMLGRDVQIVVKSASRGHSHGHMCVVALT